MPRCLIRCTPPPLRWTAGCCWTCWPTCPRAPGSTPRGVECDDVAAPALGGAAAAEPSPTCCRGARARPGRPRRDHRPRPHAARRRCRSRRTRWRKVLPKPIDHFLLQADLTVVVPGPLERDLAEQLAAVATVESAGAAMVYRISEPSIRRALDTGRTRRRTACPFRAALQNTCAAGLDLPHR